MQIDQIIRTSRKTIALIVQQDGKLIIRAPHRATDEQILRFVQQKSGWITKKQKEAQARIASSPSRQFTPGSKFLFLGKSYPLEIIDRSRENLALADGCFTLKSSALPKAKDVFKRWYQQQARAFFEQRVAEHAARYQLKYKQIKITSARTRWGSCSTSGTISFTWRLIMAPLPVIDYVIIHELAHIVEKNHSKRFWAKVAAMMPDYTKYEKWLKDNSQHLNLE